MQNSTRVLVAAALIVALLAGGIVGVAYQKAQPVEVSVSWYNATDDTANFDTSYLRTEKGMITIVPDRNISYYNVILSQVDKVN
jgi:hypothetical protein